MTTPASPGITGKQQTQTQVGDTSWHIVVLWFLGAVALIALADPAPTLATGLVVILILGTLLNNWDVYKAYLGLK